MPPARVLPIQTLDICAVEWGSAEYVVLVTLREALFRRPFGLSYSDEELLLEQADRHIAAFVDSKPVGFVSLREVADTEGQIQLRQMVVSPEMQRCGIGRKLVIAAEETAREAKFQVVSLDSREESIEFYKALGYTAVGELFFFKTVMHQNMYKNLDGGPKVISA